MVSLPNHMFTGQAYSSKQLTSIVHILCQKLTTALLESAEWRDFNQIEQISMLVAYVIGWFFHLEGCIIIQMFLYISNECMQCEKCSNDIN